MYRHLALISVLCAMSPIVLCSQHVASLVDLPAASIESATSAQPVSKTSISRWVREDSPILNPEDLRPVSVPLWTLDAEIAAGDDLVAIAQREDELMQLHPHVDVESAADRLATALRIPTISMDARTAIDSAAFRTMHAFLEVSFPRLHERLSKEVVSDLSLLYTWRGRRSDLDPILLMAHMDVVPAEQEEDWSVSPFSGTISGGYIWGRGALDDKQGVVAIMEAVERLVSEGFVPVRTIYLAFGHDEEVGGERGARQIAQLLEQRSVRLAVVVDEGGVIVKDFLPGFNRPVAGIGIAEKGSVSLELSANGNGGHSAAPAGLSAIGRVARAVHRVEKSTFPARLNRVTLQTLRGLSAAQPPLKRVVMANAALFRPLIVASMSRNPQANAMIRTTIAPTVLAAGDKANVLPSSASAIINFRAVPGETTGSIVAHVRRVVRDDEVTIRTVGTPREASSASPTDNVAFEALAEVINAITPGEDVLIVPFLVPGGTDSRHFTDIAEAIYRFTPMMLDRQALSAFHGADERIPVREYIRMIKGYHLLIQLLQTS